MTTATQPARESTDRQPNPRAWLDCPSVDSYESSVSSLAGPARKGSIGQVVMEQLRGLLPETKTGELTVDLEEDEMETLKAEGKQP